LRVINFEDHVANELARASFDYERRILRWTTALLACLTTLGLILALLMERGGVLVGLVAALTVLSAIALGAYEWQHHDQQGLRNTLRAGLRGQRSTVETLSLLDDNYYLINNLKLPNRADDVDHLVVGPNGVFALETKNHRGRIFLEDGQWYQSKTSRSGRPQPQEAIRDPTRQLKRNIDYLRACINETDPTLSRRLWLWIEGAVAFTHPGVSLDLPPATKSGLPFPALRARDLPSHILGHTPRRLLSKVEIREVVSLFGHLQPPTWNA
jgi:hypothetical protein